MTPLWLISVHVGSGKGLNCPCYALGNPSHVALTTRVGFSTGNAVRSWVVGPETYKDCTRLKMPATERRRPSPSPRSPWRPLFRKKAKLSASAAPVGSSVGVCLSMGSACGVSSQRPEFKDAQNLPDRTRLGRWRRGGLRELQGLHRLRRNRRLQLRWIHLFPSTPAAAPFWTGIPVAVVILGLPKQRQRPRAQGVCGKMAFFRLGCLSLSPLVEAHPGNYAVHLHCTS